MGYQLGGERRRDERPIDRDCNCGGSKKRLPARIEILPCPRLTLPIPALPCWRLQVLVSFP